MQTFLPYQDFVESARCLDYRRLGKQRVECLQILNALEGKSKGWTNHPATRMWRGYEDALRLYMCVVVWEWTDRGYRNNIVLPRDFVTDAFRYPPWLGDERLHASHKSNLLRKDPVHYGQFGWTEPNDLKYFWPI